MLVFFGFMPAGAILGGIAGTITFGLLAWRDGDIAIDRGPGTLTNGRFKGAPHLCNAETAIVFWPVRSISKLNC